MSSPAAVGEIIETSTLGFLAQAPALHAVPELGSLVNVSLGDARQAAEAYAVVTYSETGGIDSGRRAVRRSTEEIQDDGIYREHPELVHVLRSTFHARLVGFVDDHGAHHYLPPVPPPLHYTVRCCAKPDVRAFTDDLLYLRLLAAEDERVGVEQLLAAHIRVTYLARERDEDWLCAAGREVARLFRADYDRLLTVLRSIDPQPVTPLLGVR